MLEKINTIINAKKWRLMFILTTKKFFLVV